jgi:hypothetical protein
MATIVFQRINIIVTQEQARMAGKMCMLLLSVIPYAQDIPFKP